MEEHKLVLSQREKLAVSGVTEVVSCDEGTVVVRTVMGTLVIQGEQLQLKNLSVEGGQVAVEGSVGAIFYEKNPQKGGWLSRLFR